MPPIRVLLCNYESPPAAGGAGFASFNLGRELVQMGIKADFLTARMSNEPNVEEVDGLRIFRVPSWRKGPHDCGLAGAYSYVFFAALKRMRLLRANAYDIEHVFFGLPTGVLTRSPLPWRTPPYVLSLRGSDVPGYDPFNATVERLHKLLWPLSRRIWLQAASVVALSDGLRQIAHRSEPDLPIDVIPNGVDTERFSPLPAHPLETGNAEAAFPPGLREAPNVFQAPWAESGSPLKIVSVARLLERKGLHHLMEAIARPTPLPVALTIVGTGSYQAELERLAQELDLGSRVHFAGFLQHRELADLYRSSDLFALPSQTESFGLVFAEAMATGLPILATRVGGIPELVRDGTDGVLVDAARPDQLRAALGELIARPSKRRAMGRAARQRIEASYSWRAIAERYLATYERVLAQRGAGFAPAARLASNA